MGKHVKKRFKRPLKPERLGGDRPISKSPRTRSVFGRLLIVLALLFLAAGAAGYAMINGFEDPLLENGVNILTPPSKNQPVNILLLGSDSRGDDNGRADTIIVLRYNPKTKKAVMLSIMRDSRVAIPGYSMNKINTAHALGGLKLMVETVEEFTGLEMNHYLMIDFAGFEEVVDALGGIKIDVEKSLYDASNKINVKAGLQRMDGETALAYVRFRHDAKGDYGRIERQQKFLKAVLSESLRITSIHRIPELVSILSENTKTDMSVSQMISLGKKLSSLSGDGLDGIMLPGTPAMINGVSYVIPDEEKSKDILHRIANDLPLTDPPTVEDVKNGDVELDVRNGTGVAGMAKKLSDDLASKGFGIKIFTDADRENYQKTLIYYVKDNQVEAEKVKTYVPFAQVKKYDGKIQTKSDVLIVIGADYVSRSA